MLTVVRTLIASFILVTLFSSNTSQATITAPGAMCQPANLTQALSFGLGWSQFGLTNTSPIGGGSFFIACPIVVDEDEFNSDLFGITMDFQYLSHDSIDITCTSYSLDTSIGILSSVNLSVPSNPRTIPALQGRVSSSNAIINFSPGSMGYTIVCAMHPQTRLGHIAIESIVLP